MVRSTFPVRSAFSRSLFTKGRSVVFSAVCVLALNACSSTAKMHPDFARGTREVKSIAILPPTASFIRRNLSSKQHDSEIEAHIRNEMIGAAPSLLKERGYAVVPTSLLEQVGGEEVARQFPVLKAEHDKYAKKLYEQDALSIETPSLHVNLGPSTRTLAEDAGADALMLLTYSEQSSSVGVIMAALTVDIAVSVALGNWLPRGNGKPCNVQAILIDGRTGDVLWSNNHDTAECGRYRSALNGAFELLPHAHFHAEEE